MGEAFNCSVMPMLDHQPQADQVHAQHIDILVCNAASNPYYGPMAGIEDDQFRKILGNNVIANHWLAGFAAPPCSWPRRPAPS